MARYRVGRVQADRLGNLDEAIAALEAATTDAPRDTMILEELGRLYEFAKRWDKLAQTLETLAESSHHPNQEVGTLHAIGQIHEERLGNEDKALEWYRRALDVDPGYLPALQALAKLFPLRARPPPPRSRLDPAQNPSRRALSRRPVRRSSPAAARAFVARTASPWYDGSRFRVRPLPLKARTARRTGHHPSAKRNRACAERSRPCSSPSSARRP
jgi:tetratricopeptide (TPR) repeat protein